MKTKFIEAVSEAGNWGKFMIGVFDSDEWNRPSVVGGPSLLREVGWRSDDFMLVLDLQIGEGAILNPWGSAHADLEKHKVWVCPLFEPMLECLYAHWKMYAASVGDWGARLADWIVVLPSEIKLEGVPLQMAGYRRLGES